MGRLSRLKSSCWSATLSAAHGATNHVICESEPASTSNLGSDCVYFYLCHQQSLAKSGGLQDGGADSIGHGIAMSLKRCMENLLRLMPDVAEPGSTFTFFKAACHIFS